MRRILIWSLGAGAFCAALLAIRAAFAADAPTAVNHLKPRPGCNALAGSSDEFAHLLSGKDHRALASGNEEKGLFFDPALSTVAPGEKVNHLAPARSHSNLSPAGAAARFGAKSAAQENRSNSGPALFQDVDGKH